MFNDLPFCNADCIGDWVKAHEGECKLNGKPPVSKTGFPGSSPGAPATNYVDTGAMTLAADSLLTDLLTQDRDDPDFYTWRSRLAALLTRYMRLRGVMEKPLGSLWADETWNSVSEFLDLVERKVKSAEEALGVQPCS